MRYVAGYAGAGLVGALSAFAHAQFWVVMVATSLYIAIALPLMMFWGRRT